MHNLLTKIAAGQGSDLDLHRLKDLGEVVRNTSLCGLGQSAPNPVFSTLRYFPEEYESKVSFSLETGIPDDGQEGD
jgi:bidirectional [NiFe] hydrogenase diaphorase subunit